MPEVEQLSQLLAVEPALRALATSITDSIRSSIAGHAWRHPSPEDRAVPKLEVVALGALTYRDVYVGEKWRASDTIFDKSTLSPLDDFLQLRLYQVAYCYTVLGTSDPHLTLMTKGCVCDFPPYSHTKILKPYWLG